MKKINSFLSVGARNEIPKTYFKLFLLYFLKSIIALVVGVYYCIKTVLRHLAVISRKYTLQVVMVAVIVFITAYLFTVAHYRAMCDYYSKKSYQDSERIYRLQNDSIALRNISKHGQDKDTVYKIKVVYKPYIRRDTI